MIYFAPSILTFLFLSKSYAFELTGSTLNCIKTGRIYAPQNKFRTEFSVKFVDPKQLYGSVKHGKQKTH
jgi:hypothetical protein